MNGFTLDELNPRDELIALLDYNAMHYREDNDGVRALFVQSGCKWETVFRFARQAVLVYGVYPFTVKADVAAALGRINGSLVRGAFFCSEGVLAMRTTADLFDSYAAYEAIARAIEYNANAIVAFWAELSGLSADTGASPVR